ncbi:hypothetical protein LX36DRAFT_703593 [Colletotrichum falcatum]|nr:hypothetical protein LX36DRAFT_703593 [Colletotrichum falcatum]
MIPKRFSAALMLLGGALVGLVSAAPAPAGGDPIPPPPGTPGFLGNPSYYLFEEHDEETHRWVFQIYADGYTELNNDGQRAALDTVMVNTATKRLSVVRAMNGLDTTPNRLKMRQVLRECWRMTGLGPNDLKEVLGFKVENVDMNAALKECRLKMGLQATDSFVLSADDTDAKKRMCWNRLEMIVFSSAIQGAIRDFGVNKKLTQVKVDPDAGKDYLYYEFS